MAKKDGKTKQMSGEATDLAKSTANGAESQAREAVEQVQDEARDLAVRTAIREAPYAAIGLGDLLVETARDVEASSLPQRLLHTPVAVVSRVSNLGTDPKVTYLMLAARGHGLRLQATGGQATSAVEEHTKATAEHAQEAATATRDGAQEVAERTGAAAEATGGRAKALLGKAKGAATRRPKTDETQDDASPAPTEEEPESTADTENGEAAERTGAAEATGGRTKALLGKAKGAATRRPKTTDKQDDDAARSSSENDGSTADTGTGALENRTVTQLRNRARELDIEGRTSMKKQELVQAIRDAT
jgi:uncharacterized protein YjbJ (UPF0337 family)